MHIAREAKIGDCITIRMISDGEKENDVYFQVGDERVCVALSVDECEANRLFDVIFMIFTYDKNCPLCSKYDKREGEFADKEVLECALRLLGKSRKQVEGYMIYENDK